MSQRSTSKGHWQRRPEARAKEILDSALQVFARHGYSAATIDDIATGANVSKGTLYLYFADKEAIFRSLIGESFTPRIGQLIDSVGTFQGTSLDLLRLAIRGLGHFLQNDPRAVLPRVVMAEAGNFPDLVKFYKTEVTDRGLALIELVVRRGMEGGEFRPLDAQHAARLVMTPLMFIAFWRTSFGTLEEQPYDFQGMIDTHIDFIARALLASPAP